MRLLHLFEQERIDLHQPVVIAFKKVANQQRGRPEDLMVRLQHFMGGGVMSVLVEHIGDLTHRMTEMAEYGNFGYDPVTEKVNRGLRYLKHPYGFEREFQQNLRNNASFKGYEVEDFVSQVTKRLNRYAMAHSEITVYNELQWHGREAAVTLGQQQFELTERHLRAIESYLVDRVTYETKAAEHKMDSLGNVMPYKRRA